MASLSAAEATRPMDPCRPPARKVVSRKQSRTAMTGGDITSVTQWASARRLDSVVCLIELTSAHNQLRVGLKVQ